jgi:hypothetical protein
VSDFGKRLLLRRDFWSYPDYANHETYSTSGPQHALFDNYKWVTELGSEFKDFTERWYPVRDHTHLEYTTYVRLLWAFHHEKLGKRFQPILPKWMPLRPKYGVAPPPQAMLKPYRLYADWLRRFVRPLGINSALVCRAGCGLAAFATRMKVPMVCATDPKPLAVESMDQDRAKHPKSLARMNISVSTCLPQRGGQFDLVTLALGAPAFDADSGFVDYAYAPGLTGLRGELEELFERVSAAMKPGAVLAVLFSNVHQLAEPEQPHPVEHEIRANRRFVLLDFYSERMGGAAINTNDVTGLRGGLTGLRAELWILHRLEDLPHFGWIHGVPGAQVPAHIAAHHTRKSLAREKLRMMKARVEERGEDWESYQDRLLQVMAETPEPEDEVAMAVRAKLDPNYAEELAHKAKKKILASLEERDQEWRRIGAMPVSPRDVYDAEFAKAAAAGGSAPGAASSGSSDGSPTKRGAARKSKGKGSKRRTKAPKIETSL